MSKKKRLGKQKKRRKKEARRRARMAKTLARNVIKLDMAASTGNAEGGNMSPETSHEQADTPVRLHRMLNRLADTGG